MFPLYISLSHHFWVKMDRGSGLCSLGFPTAAFSLLHPGLNTCGWMRTSPKWPLEAMPQRIFCLSQRMCAKSLQSCLTPCKPMTSLPGSSVYGILQARILEWVAMPSSRESCRPRDWTWVSYIFFTGRQMFITSTTWEVPNRAHCCSVSKSCLTLCDSMDCSPSGSCVQASLSFTIYRSLLKFMSSA